MTQIPTNCVFCDVDGTLLFWPTIPGSPQPGETPKVNTALVDELLRWQRTSGGQLVVWSRGGREHAIRAAELCGLQAVCLAKPDVMVDDADPMRFRKKQLVVTPDTFKKWLASLLP